MIINETEFAQKLCKNLTQERFDFKYVMISSQFKYLFDLAVIYIRHLFYKIFKTAEVAQIEQ